MFSKGYHNVSDQLKAKLRCPNKGFWIMVIDLEEATMSFPLTIVTGKDN
jgi:hypothetical protein